MPGIRGKPKTMAITNVGSSAKAVSTSGGSTSYKSAFAMVTTLFFMWGFLTSLNDILIPHLKAIFDLNYAGALLIQFAFFSAYAAFGLAAGKVVEWIGYQRTMVAGLLTMGLGALMFVPAANIPSFPLFLTALIVLAAGITALQVAANPYVTVLGPPQTASSRLNLTQAFNSLGTTIGPWVGGLLILGGAAAGQETRLQQAASVKMPYIVIGVSLILFSIIIGMFKLPAIPEVERHVDGRHEGSLFKYRHLILGCVAIFTYVGAEVSIGSFLINYFNQKDIGNLPVGEGE